MWARADTEEATTTLGALIPQLASAQAQQSSAGNAAYESWSRTSSTSAPAPSSAWRAFTSRAGNGPFPAVLQVHGGAWNNKDRTDGQNTALDLAAAGIVVCGARWRDCPSEYGP
jgi:acetyl esterase/lipase